MMLKNSSRYILQQHLTEKKKLYSVYSLVELCNFACVFSYRWQRNLRTSRRTRQEAHQRRRLLSVHAGDGGPSLSTPHFIMYYIRPGLFLFSSGRS